MSRITTFLFLYRQSQTAFSNEDELEYQVKPIYGRRRICL